jgi:hypothetical protein
VEVTVAEVADDVRADDIVVGVVHGMVATIEMGDDPCNDALFDKRMYPRNVVPVEAYGP